MDEEELRTELTMATRGKPLRMLSQFSPPYLHLHRRAESGIDSSFGALLNILATDLTRPKTSANEPEQTRCHADEFSLRQPSFQDADSIHHVKNACRELYAHSSMGATKLAEEVRWDGKFLGDEVLKDVSSRGCGRLKSERTCDVATTWKEARPSKIAGLNAGALSFKREGNRSRRVHTQSSVERSNSEDSVEEVPMSPDRNASKQRRKKESTPGAQMAYDLGLCSKSGDVKGALAIFDKATQEGCIKLNQTHYNMLLYICSAAATGVLKLDANGGAKGSSDFIQETKNEDDGKGNHNDSQSQEESTCSKPVSTEGTGDQELASSNELMRLALTKGFEIYELMLKQGVPLNEASFTSVARLAEANGDGGLAFAMVKRMAGANIVPRLRSYGPALYTYCRSKKVDKAFEVDAHMLAAGIRPEEGELEALLKVSAEAGLDEKVYLLLHRLRTTVREFSPSTVETIEHWFKSEAAAVAGKQGLRNLPVTEQVKAAIESQGNWHGLGWLGKGKWKVERTQIGKRGICLCCGEQLFTVDAEPQETENFAKSLAEYAHEREGTSNKFRGFLRWLDEREPFHAVVDGANVGLHYGGEFNFHLLNAVTEALQARSPDKKLPLIFFHCRFLKHTSASSPSVQKLLRKLMEANALYTTPINCNDDWYWLYAAVKGKCFLLTNDEMRDHWFQLLAKDFFPNWKERHQVRYSCKSEVELYMPSPYSVVMQESEKGSWHVPQRGGDDIDTPRVWLCITR